MSEEKHTPRPWWLITELNEPIRDGYCHIVTDQHTLAHTTSNRDAPDEWDANARLMVAAPDLLEACKAVIWKMVALEGYAEEGPHPRRFIVSLAVVKAISAAIAKATGKEQEPTCRGNS